MAFFFSTVENQQVLFLLTKMKLTFMGKRLLQNEEEEMQYFIPSSSFTRDIDHSNLAQSFDTLYLKINAGKQKTSFVYSDSFTKDPYVQQELKGSLVFMNNFVE